MREDSIPISMAQIMIMSSHVNFRIVKFQLRPSETSETSQKLRNDDPLWDHPVALEMEISQLEIVT